MDASGRIMEKPAGMSEADWRDECARKGLVVMSKDEFRQLMRERVPPEGRVARLEAIRAQDARERARKAQDARNYARTVETRREAARAARKARRKGRG